MNVKSILFLATLFACSEKTFRAQAQLDQNETIPNVTFCEMVKQPQLYSARRFASRQSSKSGP